MKSEWVFLYTTDKIEYWTYSFIEVDMASYFGRTQQRNISELVCKLAVL